jgi:hypothetical protein
VYAVIAQLEVLAERFPQALGQLATVLEAPALGVEFGVDSDADPHDVVGDAVIALRVGAERAHDLGRRLGDAQSAVGHRYIARRLTAVEVESDE